MMIEKFAEMIKECSSIVFFGGAGVSTESGVKDYRSQDGLYNTVKEYGVPPEEILSHDFFFQNTAMLKTWLKVWKSHSLPHFFNLRFLQSRFGRLSK